MERGIIFNGHITNYIKGSSISFDRAYSVIVLLLLSLILYRKNRKTIIMQKMIIGQKVTTAFELTISEVVLGIFAGTAASLIMSYLGIFFREDSAIYLIFLISMFL